VIPLYEPGSRERVLAVSPTGKVPALVDGDIHVWESLAILDYLAEKFPAEGLWPSDLGARAHARAIAAEMHAGFAALRRLCPMNMWRAVRPRELTPEAAADVRRIEALWTDCRMRYGRDGPFLFGHFGAADAMYAPIVSRLHTYAVPVGPAARAYMEAVMALQAFAEWRAGALLESWVMPRNEVDWPDVPRS
jgi:glutathione S-transferase